MVPPGVAGAAGPRSAAGLLLAALPPVGLGVAPSAEELALSEGELVVTKASLDELHDELYVLACAVDDADDDLATELATARPRVTELRRIVSNLLDAARPLRDRELPAPSVPAPIPS